MMFDRRFAHLLLVGWSCGALVACQAKERDFETARNESKSGTGGAGTGDGGPDASAGGGGVGGAKGTGGGTGSGGEGPAQVCTPKAPVCDGNRPTTCLSDGSGYVAGGKACGTGQTCKDGACQDDPCVAGEDFCLLNEVRRCADDAQSSVSIKKCTANQFCNAKTVKCEAQNCTPGTRTCGTGDQPQVCADDGSGFIADGDPCGGTNPLCQGEGVCVCEVGAARCDTADSTQPQLCNNNHAWINKGEPCKSAVYAGCDSGRCVTETIAMSYADQWKRGTDPNYSVTHVDNVNLDKYEVTVGQYRRFVDAVVNDHFRPASGSGKHRHLENGKGLQNGGSAGGYERGWDPIWDDKLFPNKVTVKDANGQDVFGWDYWLVMTGYPLTRSKYATWTPEVGPNEDKPINMITWYEAYAYCIWDDGFLPSEAEWEWAARGGQEARPYPWGSEDPGPNVNRAVYGCRLTNGSCAQAQGFDSIADVDLSPPAGFDHGDAHEGFVQMAGNVWEWTLDWHIGNAGDPPVYPATCYNCAILEVKPADPQPILKVHRGGDFYWGAGDLKTDAHRVYQHDWRDHYGGVRCAHPS